MGARGRHSWRPTVPAGSADPRPDVSAPPEGRAQPASGRGVVPAAGRLRHPDAHKKAQRALGVMMKRCRGVPANGMQGRKVEPSVARLLSIYPRARQTGADPLSAGRGGWGCGTVGRHGWRPRAPRMGSRRVPQPHPPRPAHANVAAAFRVRPLQAAIATLRKRSSTKSASSCGEYLATKALAPTRSTIALLNTPDSEVCSSTYRPARPGWRRISVVSV